MNTLDMFRSAFQIRRKALEMKGESNIRHAFEEAVNNYGPALRDINTDIWRNTLRHVVSYTETPPTYQRSYYLDEEKLKKFLDRWTEAEIAEAVAKMYAKVGNLTDVKITAGDASSWFVVTGKHPNGSDVKVTQTQKINFSSRGLMFNQWPALITVNGKRVSESAYQKIV